MLPTVCLKLADQQFAKVMVTKDIGKGGLGLQQNLLTMGHKKKLGLLLFVLEEAFKIESSDHGLAGAGGGYDQVAPAIMGSTFSLQCFQYSFLKRVGAQIKEHCRAI